MKNYTKDQPEGALHHTTSAKLAKNGVQTTSWARSIIEMCLGQIYRKLDPHCHRSEQLGLPLVHRLHGAKHNNQTTKVPDPWPNSIKRPVQTQYHIHYPWPKGRLSHRMSGRTHRTNIGNSHPRRPLFLEVYAVWATRHHILFPICNGHHPIKGPKHEHGFISRQCYYTQHNLGGTVGALIEDPTHHPPKWDEVTPI